VLPKSQANSIPVSNKLEIFPELYFNAICIPTYRESILYLRAVLKSESYVVVSEGRGDKRHPKFGKTIQIFGKR
jgi:hypothetical protein